MCSAGSGSNGIGLLRIGKLRYSTSATCHKNLCTNRGGLLKGWPTIAITLSLHVHLCISYIYAYIYIIYIFKLRYYINHASLWWKNPNIFHCREVKVCFNLHLGRQDICAHLLFCLFRTCRNNTDVCHRAKPLYTWHENIEQVPVFNVQNERKTGPKLQNEFN